MGAKGPQGCENSGTRGHQTVTDIICLSKVFRLHSAGHREGEQDVKLARGMRKFHQGTDLRAWWCQGDQSRASFKIQLSDEEG